MIPLHCLFAAFVMLYPVLQDDQIPGGIIRVRSDVTCDVRHEFVPEGIKLLHRFVTSTVPVPADGQWHMIVYDFKNDYAEVSVMTTQQVKRFVGAF